MLARREYRSGLVRASDPDPVESDASGATAIGIAHRMRPSRTPHPVHGSPIVRFPPRTIWPVSTRQTSWSQPSQVFTDTQKVDLFNDPCWEVSLPPERHRRPRRPKVHRVHNLAKKGRHSRGVHIPQTMGACRD